MSRYTFHESGAPTLRGRLTYLVDEYGFRFVSLEESCPADLEIIIRRLALGVVQHTGMLTAISGYAPDSSWKDGTVPEPRVLHPRLMLNEPGRLGPAATATLAPRDAWGMTYDSRTGLLQIGLAGGRPAVAFHEIATDVIVALGEDRSLTEVVLRVHRARSEVTD